MTNRENNLITIAHRICPRGTDILDDVEQAMTRHLAEGREHKLNMWEDITVLASKWLKIKSTAVTEPKKIHKITWKS